MTVADHYLALCDRGRTLTEAMVADGASLALQTKSHNFIGDYELLRVSIEDRPESFLLSAGITEYQYSLYALSIGNYRHSFSSLRLFMELFLGAVHFSGHEIKFRKWVLDSQDIVWSAIVDKENGVFANSFIGAFFPDVRTEGGAYRALAEAAYRECSQYVHGNYKTHKNGDLDREFDAAVFAAWHDRAETVRACLFFAFASRYLPFIGSAKLGALEGVVLDVLSSLSAVRGVFDAKRVDQ